MDGKIQRNTHYLSLLEFPSRHVKLCSLYSESYSQKSPCADTPAARKSFCVQEISNPLVPMIINKIYSRTVHWLAYLTQYWDE